MPSTASIISQLRLKYPDITFTPSDVFSWSPKEKTVYFIPDQPDTTSFLMHELSHAILGHDDYSRDIELVNMESKAWDKAVQVGQGFGITISEDTMQDNIDTYRDWLHARSTCPNCQSAGVQDKKNTYQCPACGHYWRVNEARLCGLKRYSME